MSTIGWTIHEIAPLIHNRQISAVELLTEYMGHLDKTSPVSHSFTELYTYEAMKCAMLLDSFFATIEHKSPLFAIPFAVKDNFYTDNHRTTAGSYLLANFIPDCNAKVINNLLYDNPIMIGKTNMDQFALGSSTKTSVYTPSVNPFGDNRVPGGSSGGSASAVAFGEVVFALGTDTGGSLRQPASYCGLVTMKPSSDLLSQVGIIPLAQSLDAPGPLCRDVLDLAIVMDSMSDRTLNSVATIDDYVNNGIGGVKVLLIKELMGDTVHPDIKSRVLKIAADITDNGGIVEEISLPVVADMLPLYHIVSAVEFNANLKDRFGTGIKPLPMTTANICEEVISRSIFGEHIREQHHLYNKAIYLRNKVITEINNLMSKYDFILSPTVTGTAFGFDDELSPLEMHQCDLLTVLANVTGIPAVSVPCGDVDCLPYGAQIMSAHGEDSKLIAMSKYIEQLMDYKILSASIK